MTSRTLGPDQRRRLEALRLRRQDELDSERSAKERNAWGQFATPSPLARDIVSFCLQLHGRAEIDFLEPSCGSGAFFSALLSCIDGKRLHSAQGVELDERFARLASELWADSGLEVRQADYLELKPAARASTSLLIANPPYVRHHHLSSTTKRRAAARCMAELGLKPSGLSGLYLYFVLLSHQFLAPGAISAWLIPSEFLDVNYGSALKTYLTKDVRLKRIHRFDASDAQFDDALVTSAVVVFENDRATSDHLVEFSQGGTVQEPRTRRNVLNADLTPSDKWAAHFRRSGIVRHEDPILSDYFRIRRGIATGSNKFFILERAEATRLGIREENLRPILPGPRYIRDSTIPADDDGYPLVDKQLVVIDSVKPMDELKQSDPALASYLDSADDKVKKGYLVSKRSPWYRQEQRPPAPLLITYMGRGVDLERPFRFILNHSKAVATNMFLMLYPLEPLGRFLDANTDGLELVHKALLSLTGDDLRNGGRVYGGGLHKIEPKELAQLRASCIRDLDPALLSSSPREPRLF